MDMNTMYATNQGYQTGNPNMQAMGYNPAMMNQFNQKPQMTNPLTQEEYKILLTEQDCFNLKVTKEEIARAVCTHKHPEQGSFATVPGKDPAGDVTCTICHTKFYPDLVTPEYVKQTTDAMLNILQTLKWLGVDLSSDVIRQYFAMIPYIERVPKLYEAVNNTFNKYHVANPTVQATGPNIYNMYNMLANPAVAMATPQMVNPYPYYNTMQGMQNNMVAGGSPFYAQPQQAPQQQMMPQQPYMNAPMQGGAPIPPATPNMTQPYTNYPVYNQPMMQQPQAPVQPNQPVAPAPQPQAAQPQQQQAAPQQGQDVQVTQPVNL